MKSAAREAADPLVFGVGRRREAGTMRRVLGKIMVAVACGSLAVLGACSSDGGGVTDTGPPGASSQAATGPGEATGEAFTFAEDDLCEWLTPDDVGRFYTTAYGTDVTVTARPSVDTGPDECGWLVTPTSGDESVDSCEVSASVSDGSGVVGPVKEIIEYSGGGVPVPGATVSGHPALGDAVLVQSEGWGVYAFWVPPADQYLVLVDCNADSGGADVQTRLFTFATLVLQELGWVTVG
jgi:hypothetical protein